MVDQTASPRITAYNALGQLTDVTDANGNLIVSYTYNLAGQLVGEVQRQRHLHHVHLRCGWRAIVTSSIMPPTVGQFAASPTPITRSALKPA